MKEQYVIAIGRPGLADIPELVRAQTPEIAAAVVRALLECRDENIRQVRVEINRTTTKEVVMWAM